jgi:hypothetical protein
VIGAIVAAFAFFDGVFLGAPIAVLAASLRNLSVFVPAAIAVCCISIVCSRWVNRRWDDWFSGNGKRIGKRMEAMRTSRLMRHPVEWIERGSDRSYALAAALANPILVVAFARSVGDRPIAERRILMGSIAYALPYVAVWTLLGFALGDVVHAAAGA